MNREEKIALAEKLIDAMADAMPPEIDAIEFASILCASCSMIFGRMPMDPISRRLMLAGWCAALQAGVPVNTHPMHETMQ